MRDRTHTTQLYDFGDLAKVTGIPADTLGKWVRGGRIPGQDVGVGSGKRFSARRFEEVVEAVRRRRDR